MAPQKVDRAASLGTLVGTLLAGVVLLAVGLTMAWEAKHPPSPAVPSNGHDTVPGFMNGRPSTVRNLALGESQEGVVWVDSNAHVWVWLDQESLGPSVAVITHQRDGYHVFLKKPYPWPAPHGYKDMVPAVDVTYPGIAEASR